MEFLSAPGATQCLVHDSWSFHFVLMVTRWQHHRSKGAQRPVFRQRN